MPNAPNHFAEKARPFAWASGQTQFVQNLDNPAEQWKIERRPVPKMIAEKQIAERPFTLSSDIYFH